jgi:hypothetical protein
MGTSAFDILIMPVFLATLGSCVAGAAILGLMNAIETLVDRVLRAARCFKALPRVARDPPRRVDRPSARGVGSTG